MKYETVEKCTSEGEIKCYTDIIQISSKKVVLKPRRKG
jgi:hypothetical protein